MKIIIVIIGNPKHAFMLVPAVFNLMKIKRRLRLMTNIRILKGEKHDQR